METEEKPEKPDMTFTRELRKATKDVHNISDSLVNAKFVFALTDDAVWADGLLAFHEIYTFFEQHLPDDLLPVELHRANAFENDLAFFLGENWKENYEPRDSVKKYLKKLDEVRLKSDKLLFAYAYQMYMALMSGGQLLQKKRMIARNLWKSKPDESLYEEPSNKDADPGDLEARPMPKQVTICPPGCNSTYFPEKISILKDKLRTIMNSLYGAFDDQMRADFIEESRNVFIYNCDVVRSIRGVNRVYLRRLFIVVSFVAGLVLAYKLAKN